MNTLTDTHQTTTNSTLNGSTTARAGRERRADARDIANLVVRIAGADDSESIDELAQRSGEGRTPAGALMLGAVDGRVLAAASMSSHEALSEPTPSGAAASAVLEYTLANLERRGSMPRRAA